MSKIFESKHSYFINHNSNQWKGVSHYQYCWGKGRALSDSAMDSLEVWGNERVNKKILTKNLPTQITCQS